MKKRLSIPFLFLSILCCVPLMAAGGDVLTGDTLVVNAVVPEDYGIVFPQDALHMDRLYFAVRIDDTDDYLVRTEVLDAGILSPDDNELRISLLYYGNQIGDYSFVLEAEAETDWMDDDGNTLPLQVSLDENTDAEDDIDTVSIADSELAVSVPPVGPRRGDPVADIVLTWNESWDAVPGGYSAQLSLRMKSLL